MRGVPGYILLLTLFWSAVSPLVYAQGDKHRTVEQADYEGPVEVVDLNIGGQTALVSDKVVASKDWLKTLTLNVRNTHSQSIVYMEIELEIAKTGKMEYPLRLLMTFGQIPPAAGESSPSKASEKLAPNKIKGLSLSEEMHDFFINFMRENQIDDIEKVKLFVEFIVFSDGTAWNKGHIMNRDPANPKRWLVKGI